MKYPTTKTPTRKVSVQKVLAKTSENFYHLPERCHLGVSFGNSFFEGRDLNALLKWISENFVSCHAVLGGYLERHNEDIFAQESSRKSYKHSTNEAYVSRNAETLKRYDNVLKLSRSKEFIENGGAYNDEFSEYKDRLQDINQNNREFNNLVRRAAGDFIARRTRNGYRLSIPKKNAIEKSTEFILEEISIYCVLVHEGWPVEVYPGPELPVLEACLDGSFPDAPTPLTERINIQVKINKEV